MAGTAWSQSYTYDFSDNFTSATIDSNKWNLNGNLKTSSTGLTSSDGIYGTGGSVIAKNAPDGPLQYEAKAILNIRASGGIYTLFAHATADARTGNTTATGSYYAVQVVNPTVSAGSCIAPIQYHKRYNGADHLIWSYAVSCQNGLSLRLVVRTGYQLVWAQPSQTAAYGEWNDQVPAGQPGVEVIGAPDGNTIALVQAGPLDITPPTVIDPKTVSAMPLPNRVELQWRGVIDGGIGLMDYLVYRNDSAGNPQYIGSVTTPAYTDETVSPNATYTYQIQSHDQHGNVSAAVPVTPITTPPANSIEPRQVGVRPNGAYWGGAGEQIDVYSGNLNYSVPLLRAQGRGWEVPIGLSYNSMLWRYDHGVDWKLGRDIGYGFGWVLQAGSIRPVWTYSWSIHHYVFSDSTGAEYRLDRYDSAAGTWSSAEGIYATFNPQNRCLYFNDGKFWVMGAESAGMEDDAGTLYPTIIEDSNGNQVRLNYMHGVGNPWDSTSGRFTFIEDARAQVDANSGLRYTYNFGYNWTPDGAPGPYLNAITNTLGSAEQYRFTQTPVTLYSPFTGSASTTAHTLTSVSGYWLPGITQSMSYNASGELLQVNTPQHGYLNWTYAPTTSFDGQRQYRAVQFRRVSSNGSTVDSTHQVFWDGGPHYNGWVIVADWDHDTEKAWAFNGPGTYLGLPSEYEDRGAGGIPMVSKFYYWTQDPVSNPYLSSTTTVIEPTGANLQTRSTQTLDAYGNVTQSAVYDYGSGGPVYPARRTYTSTYVTDAAYTSRYLRNRLLSSSVTQGSSTVTLVTNAYDQSVLTNRTGLFEHDSANYGTGFTLRGNVTQSTQPGKIARMTYDITGMVVGTDDNYGHTVTIDPAANSNNAAPGKLTPRNDLNKVVTMAYNTFLAPASTTGPNGDTATQTYDVYGRVASTTTAQGLPTSYSYDYPNNLTTATTAGRVTKTYSDGFGRPVRVETGDGATTLSIVETKYAACACSPMGKMSAVSQPYKPGDTVKWTTYTYDGLGRPTKVTLPDGSFTTYAYTAQKVTVTDPAGAWKMYERDAVGNLVKVTEPNPSGGNLETRYTYDVLDHLTQVYMQRGATVQTRTFTYDANQRLQQVSNPETGTVTYAYNQDGSLASKTDAKGQKTAYSYDPFGRILTINHYASANSPADPCQSVAFGYDVLTPGMPGTVSNYLKGRVAQVYWGSTNTAAGCSGTAFEEDYAYSQSGFLSYRRLTVYRNAGGSGVAQGSLDTAFEHTLLGNLYWVQPPILSGLNATSYWYAYDALGRPTKLQKRVNGTVQKDEVSNATYGPANEQLTMTWTTDQDPGPPVRPAQTFTETRTYNERLQLTGISVPGMATLGYTYASQPNNNGRLKQMTTTFPSSTAETVTYGYDTLNRLTSAQTPGTSGTDWGLSFTYDGFGNKTAQTVTKGTAPGTSLPVDGNNRLNVAGFQYDLNGNVTQTPDGATYVYDVENRLSQVNGGVTAYKYLYHPAGQRVCRNDGGLDCTEIYTFGPNGEKLGTYKITGVSGAPPYQSLTFQEVDWQLYFGGRLVRSQGKWLVTDRVGSVVADNAGRQYRYYPYGEERPGATAQGTQKFGTYFRDLTGLDYAQQRYYDSWRGRFMSPDPGAGGDPANPGSMNRYAYTLGDPVNLHDSHGLLADPMDGYCPAEFADCGQWNWLGRSSGNDDVYTFPCMAPAGFTRIPGTFCFAPLILVPKRAEPNCGITFFSTFGLISNGEQDAVSVILGENSWNYMGTRQYLQGQRYGHGTGAIIGVPDVSLEDAYMADVILNRVAQWGGTLSSQASNQSQFNGYSAGAQMFRADMSVATDTTQCSDLLVAFSSLRAEETRGRLNTSILYWGAVINPQTNRAIGVRPGEFMVADTVFGAMQVYR